jgi:D-arabinan exo alpha-(1,3)/(1,5)-arabinofuranosidase (non-reducing end)
MRKSKTAIARLVAVDGLIGLAWIIALTSCAPAPRTIAVETLLAEMTDLENLALRPEPFFKQAQASSYDRQSREGRDSDAWFANRDVGQYVRTETNGGRTEHVLADLTGPGTVTRFWSANPDRANIARFYFDGETSPRLELPFRALFLGGDGLFLPDFSYISGTGGNLYFPLPYAVSLKITVEETGGKPLRLYYEIGHRTYGKDVRIETFDPKKAARWKDEAALTARRLARPEPAAPAGAGGDERSVERLTVPPGESASLPTLRGEKTVFEWSARVLGLRETHDRNDPLRGDNAHRALVLEVLFDGERSIATPLGDFFGSGPGVNPYENLFFTVDATGRMTSRLLMPFAESMDLRLTNRGRVPYTVEIVLRAAARPFTGRGYHLRAQWRSLVRETWPPFDTNLLDTTGEGKVIGTVYEIANDGLIWWGEGDQKVSVDGEPFPSTFGTGTEDDYGYAYGDNRPFVRPYHAQTRVDGPASGGHISLNRWYVLDALPYRSTVRFDQEVWHWMPCRPTWGHVVYWYAKPGTPGPAPVDAAALGPVDLGPRERMLEPLEGEDLRFEAKGGTAGRERLANCSGAEHLVWRGARPGGRLAVHFTVTRAGRYAVELNLCMSPDCGRYGFAVDGKPSGTGPINAYADKLWWTRPKLGVFDLVEGDNVLEVRTLAPDPAARPGDRFGLDYIFLISDR